MTTLAIYLICLGLVWAFVRGADDRTSFESERLVQTEYAARWPELTPPTLVECEAFLAAVGAQ